VTRSTASPSSNRSTLVVILPSSNVTVVPTLSCGSTSGRLHWAWYRCPGRCLGDPATSRIVSPAWMRLFSPGSTTSTVRGF
jgi:hypothetical protein